MNRGWPGLGLGSAAGEAEGAGLVAWVVERRRGSSVARATPTDVGFILTSGTEQDRRFVTQPNVVEHIHFYLAVRNDKHSENGG